MSVPTETHVERIQLVDGDRLRLRCTACASAMEKSISLPGHMLASLIQEEVGCTVCGSVMLQKDGIWNAMRHGRASLLASSLSSYESVRKAEGRWSADPEFYLALPWRDLTGKFNDQWKIRARSFRFLCEHILPVCQKITGKRRLRILDLGAGNCWMSYRLTLVGHLPVAVDLSVSRWDGLGAAKNYSSVLDRAFSRFQAEMDWLPFEPNQFDLAIFNASLHYANDYETTMREALRVLSPKGAIAIVDSPTYAKEVDGQAMKREKTAEFTNKFGTDHGGMGGQEYLTPQRLADLERIGIRWQRYSPWYGWQWATRAVKARLAGRRKPSNFYMYLGTRAPEATEGQ